MSVGMSPSGPTWPVTRSVTVRCRRSDGDSHEWVPLQPVWRRL